MNKHCGKWNAMNHAVTNDLEVIVHHTVTIEYTRFHKHKHMLLGW